MANVYKGFCGPQNVENKPWIGRLKVLADRCPFALLETVKKYITATVPGISAEIRAASFVKVSDRTTKRNLHCLGYFKRAKAKPLDGREVNRKERLQYYRSYLHLDVTKSVKECHLQRWNSHGDLATWSSKTVGKSRGKRPVVSLEGSHFDSNTTMKFVC